jgi:putative hydrolase of the HAD superfamily
MSAGPSIPARTAPDFRHIDTWIFDLDNTLYRAETDLFAQIDMRMGAYVARLLDLPPDEARRLQKAYYRDHGTTLNGLIALHDVDAEDFLEDVHDIDLSALTPDLALNAAKAKLPGRRFVFTNGCGSYAARVLERIGLSTLADDVWDIRTAGFVPKPFAAAYDTVVARSGIAPQHAAMFEDLARNLVPARALGMTTVWLDNGSVWSRQGPDFPVADRAHIDYETNDLGAFLSTVRTGP